MNTLFRIQEKIISKEKIPNILNEIKSKKIVFTNGCFDILHKGHLTYLSQAKDLGDILWIGLNSDFSVKKLKGESRPVNNHTLRAMLLASLFYVDFVSIFEEENPICLIEIIKPHIHVKGGDYQKEKLIEYETVIQYGGQVEILPFVEGESTTQIIKKIQASPPFLPSE